MTFKLDLDLHLAGTDGDFRPATDFARWAESAELPLDGVSSDSMPLCTTVPAQELHDMTVMIADRDTRMTSVMQTCLQAQGYRHFVSVHDPLWVVDAARRHRPGLLLLDLSMDGDAGFDILWQMRSDEHLRYIPVIGLAASQSAVTKLKALELGAVEILSKPVVASELVLRVRNSLEFRIHQERLANEDPLTNLPNRRVFLERLRLVLNAPRENRSLLALLHIGMDRFKQINNSLGDRAGDQLLGAIAVRLQSALRRGDGSAGRRRSDAPMLSRLGGDEFALLLPEINSVEGANRVARRILSAMSRPFQHDGKDLFITPSIGIAMYPNDGLDDETLRRNAVAAMVHAKSSGRNTYHFYSTAITGVSRERLAMETRLRRAIERDELRLYYQPKIDMTSGRVVGAEALLRWKHSEQGLVPPDQFIPLAEQSGLIVEIGEWVVDRACAQMARWRVAGMDNIRVAINVSRQEVVAGGLVRVVGDAITRHGIRPGQLVVELTESMLMDRVEHIREQLEALRGLGVLLSIDDFGTGYSSMGYLKRFPLDELKIDKSFVSGTPDDATDVAIVKAIIALAHSLELRVVAEGVESEAQRALLLSLSCDVFQGY
ncbi:MAG: EAL domain-containing protein, partial [Rhizobacter sp.]|nr:EAL domain-containing protein [Rhizobacter sp.]